MSCKPTLAQFHCLVPRPSTPPAFDRYTGSDQKLEVWKAWERGYSFERGTVQLSMPRIGYFCVM